MQEFTLTTPSYFLSAPRPADVPALATICADPDIQRWTTIPAGYSRSDAEAFVTEFAPRKWAEGSPVWLIRHNSQSAPLGCVQVDVTGNGRIGRLGFWAAKEARNTGMVTEAVRAALEYFFDKTDLAAMHWDCEVQGSDINWASAKIAWKLGFSFLGIRPAVTVNKGEVYGLFQATLQRGEAMEPAHAWFGPSEKHPAFSDPRRPEDLVRQFHETYALPIVTDGPNAHRPRLPMRMSLIAEEFTELVTAAYGKAAGEQISAAFERAVDLDDESRDIVEISDALADLVYVIYGMALELGIPMADVLAEVQASNLSKLGADGRPIYREDGKVLKGPHFFNPDIPRVLGLAPHNSAEHSR